MSQPDRTAGVGLEGAGDTVESCYAAGLWTLDRGDTDGARYWLARCNAACVASLPRQSTRSSKPQAASRIDQPACSAETRRFMRN